MLGRVEETVTHLEMTSPADLRPAPLVPGLSLDAVPADSPLIRSTTLRIGAPAAKPA